MNEGGQKVELIKGSGVPTRKVIERNSGKLKVAAYCRVSTDSDEQMSSYKSQKEYYESLIKKHDDWIFAGIYADAAITGTSTDKREEFQRMIADCLAGRIDLVICKSISRFARNTVDTLQHVRMLKDNNVEVFFEEENIRTLSMDGELLLTVLSSVAQQEVQNISDHVKSGLSHKMAAGELVGFSGCLGYDYDPVTKSISVNQDEAEVVRYIFARYLEGVGAQTISHELEQKGKKTKRGKSVWPDTTIIGILKNEKYVGDLLSGKTMTVDPISKRRLKNYGEVNKYLIRNHHEAIVSREEFDEVQKILEKRNHPRVNDTTGVRTNYSRKYTFSSRLECGYCHHVLTRRNWHSGTSHQKTIWQCQVAVKKGQKYCQKSKGIEEKLIEQAFMGLYSSLVSNDSNAYEKLMKRIETTLSNDGEVKHLEDVDDRIAELKRKDSTLIDLLVDKKITDEEYDIKHKPIIQQLNYLDSEKQSLSDSTMLKKEVMKRVSEFRKAIEENKVLTEFDPTLFETIVEKVIVGGYDENNKPDPYKLTFIFKIGITTSIDSSKYRTDLRKKSALPSPEVVTDTVLPSAPVNDARRDSSIDVKKSLN